MTPRPDFGVSRPIVREALRSLVERGLIDIEPGRGAFVHGDTGPRRFPPLDLEYRHRGTTARQLSDARLMLEMEAAALPTEHTDEGDLSNMELATTTRQAKHRLAIGCHRFSSGLLVTAW
jgi:GntR family transcriptional regulator, transcriptional repressor for pyruvate dehydrogenase complex